MKLYSQEWSEFVDADEISKKPMTKVISIPEKNKNLVSKRLGIVSIEELVATVQLERNTVNQTIYANGELTAKLTQNCIVTAEPIEEEVKGDFEGWFANTTQAVSFEKVRRERLSQKEQEDLPIMDESDDPEPIVEGKIDIGELVVQNLSLIMNPYPKKQGVRLGLETAEDQENDDYDYSNPFAKLKDWKGK